MMQSLLDWDQSLFYMINKGLGSVFLDPLMLIISEDIWWAWLIVFCFLLSLSKWWKQHRTWITLAIVSMAIVDSISFRIMKPEFKRLRPCYQLENVRLVTDSCGGIYSFPSNHAANSMATAGVAFVLYGSRSFLYFLALALWIGFSRVYLGVHFPLDVGVGWSIGLVTGLIVAYLYKYLRRQIKL